jgi:hypothetical protein
MSYCGGRAESQSRTDHNQPPLAKRELQRSAVALAKAEGPSRCVLFVMLCCFAATGCSNNRLSTDEAQRLIEASPRFTAPNVVTVRSQYCSTIDAPADNVGAGLGRLKALEAAGAIRIARRAAAPNECTSLPSPMRERLLISPGGSSSTFHPRILGSDALGAGASAEAAGWEYTLARRRFVSIGEVTFNSDDDPTLARAVYKWAWKSELLGQLLQVSEEPVNAQATFLRNDNGWQVRDVGF